MSKQRLEFELVGNITDFTTNIKAAQGDLGKLAKAANESLNGLPSKGNLTKEMIAGQKAARAYIAELEKLRAAGKNVMADLTPRQRTQLTGKRLAYEESLKAARPSAIEAAEAKKRTADEKALVAAEKEREKQEKALAAAVKQTEKADQQATKAVEASEKAAIAAEKARHNRAITLRYALYDVSSAARTGADALLRYSGAVYGAAFAQQQSFSQVEKTQVGVSPEVLDNLFKSLQQLSTEIPVTFDELSKLSMLGAQLGIKTDSLDEFSATVAKFSTVTGVTIEDAALKFGKLSSLLKVPAEDFDKLASSIAYVGVNGASTEAAILSTAQQIGAVGNAAGLSTSEVVGLASAFASLGVAPEEARGVLIPTMNLIDKSVNSFNETLGRGNETLGVFARTAGVSAEEFVAKWGDKTGGGAGEIFKKFVAGLGSDQVKISTVLAQLNLDGTRTSKGLTALGDNADFVFSQMSDAAKGLGNNFLDDSFAKTADDINRKLQMLDASFQNLMQSAGGNPAILGILGVVIDAAKNLNVALKSITDASPTLSFLIALGTAAVALTGSILGVVAILASARAGFFALQTAFFASGGSALSLSGMITLLTGRLLGIQPAAVTAAAGLSATAAAETAVGTAATTASVGVTILSTALKSIPFIAVAAGLIALIDLGVKHFTTTENSTQASEDNADALKAQRDAMRQLKQELIDNVDMALEGTDANLKLQSALFAMGKGAQGAKNNFNEMTADGQSNMNNLRSVISAMAESANGDTRLLAANLIGLRNALIAAGITAAPAMQMIEDAIAGTGETVAGVVFDITAFNNGLNDVPRSAGKAQTALERLMEILDKLFSRSDARSGIQGALEALGESIAENGKRFGYSTSGMVANVEALKEVIRAFATGSGGDVNIFSKNLQGLRASLVKMGITGGESLRLIDAALAKIKGKSKVSAKEITAIYNSINNAVVANQQENIRTISDYVSDLTGVLDKAFSNRYGKEAARDSITSAFNDMRDAAKAAEESILDAQQAIDGLRADKNVLEYQLAVAIKYGDTLRADSIRGKIAKLNGEIADQEESIATAREESSKTLTGNSKAAITNRATIRGLVQSGADYLATLAQTGMSTEDLKKEAAALSAEFLEQGKQLGFAEEELSVYTKAFETDFTTVIDELPKDVTLEVNSDPALAAVREFVANVNEELKGIEVPVISSDISVGNGAYSSSGGSGTSTGGGGTSTVTPTPASQATPNADITNPNSRNYGGLIAKDGYSRKYNTRTGRWEYQITPAPLGSMGNPYKPTYAGATPPKNASYTVPLGKYVKMPKGLYMQGISGSGNNAILRWGSAPNALNKKIVGNTIKVERDLAGNLTPWTKFATGGYVSGPGTSTSDSIPASLSNGEYVLKANAVKHYGVEFMNALNQMKIQRPAFSQGGLVSATASSSVVYLSPEDRSLLRAAIDRPIALYTENTKIAQSANAGNVVLAQRGSN